MYPCRTARRRFRRSRRGRWVRQGGAGHRRLVRAVHLFLHAGREDVLAPARGDAGTIEQVYLSPLPFWLVAAAGRVGAALLETLLVAAGTYGIVSAFIDVRIDWNTAALLPAVMIMLAAVGMSLIIAGATLVWKRIQLVNDTVLMVVMMFSASALPLIDVPGW